jgi:hypothetical protein
MRFPNVLRLSGWTTLHTLHHQHSISVYVQYLLKHRLLQVAAHRLLLALQLGKTRIPQTNRQHVLLSLSTVVSLSHYS